MNDNNGQVESGPDLVGGPFAVIESDPGVFTSLIRKLGIKNIDLVELYDIEPWAVDHLNPYGLVFCFHWAKDSHRPADFEDPTAERVWFANQLSDDAYVGRDLELFKMETREMSSVMKGLAISSSSFIRNAHNSLARPADIRGALNSVSITTLDAHAAAQKEKAKEAKAAKANANASTAEKKPPPKKRGRKPKDKPSSPAKPAKKKTEDTTSANDEEAYHFIGYVPAYGKVWELDGFKSGPLEVGELSSVAGSIQDPSSSTSSHLNGPSAASSSSSTHGWMDVVRPALRMKMQKYGGGSEEGNNNIRFSLLAIVDGTYERANDEWEYWRRERASLERRLNDIDPEGWKSKVDPNLLAAAEHAFKHPLGENSRPRIFASDFASRRNQRDMTILTMSSPEELYSAWQDAVTSATRAKVELEDELAKARRDYTDHVKRTHDYEPFLTEFIKCLDNEDLIDALLDSRSRPGRKKKSSQTQTKRQGKGASTSRGPAKKKIKAETNSSKYKDDDEDWEDEADGSDKDKGDGDWKPGSRRR